jgi:GNAT superfamily N-acetyltransferase
MDNSYLLRAAGAADAGAIARHRGLMFLDMGLVDEADAYKLSAASQPWFSEILERGLYKAWMVEWDGKVVGGGGLHLSEMGPLPGAFRIGTSAHVANVYTDRDHRKRGIARSLLNEMMRWCREFGIDQLTLTASEDGRLLYKSLGFQPQPDTMMQRFTQSKHVAI